ncbi:MAG: CPBP family glutamic-type intramembrane protease, partial [Planctomycetota bacterium]
PTVRAIAIQAALFAAAHGSVHRLAVTFGLGLLLGTLRVRTGSLLPCVLVHFGYNATLVLAQDEHAAWLEHGGPLGLSAVALAVLGPYLACRSIAPEAQDEERADSRS